MKFSKKDEELDKLRHSAAHVLAHAVKDLFPETKLGIGPSIRNGFYYDFDREGGFTEEDLPKIEKRMREIIESKHRFEREEMAKPEAIDLFKRRGENFKVELIEEIPDEKVAIYRSGEFVDLCKGPHVEHTGLIKGLKLLNVAGAYWRGDENNKMLTRIYGTAFFEKKDLRDYLNKFEEAKKRDHRKLGRELDLFSFHEEGPGFPFYHPKGMIVYNSLLDFWREEHKKEKYEEIKTPMILREELWKRSGHYEHYKDHMYFTQIEGQNFAIKPMNCPGGLLIYKSRQHSYREFPMRYAELGQVHRHELSGVLHGLFRAKTFTIDDAHIYCLEGQIESEIRRCLDLILRIYGAFGFKSVMIELSTKPADSMGSDEIWEKATSGLEEALKANGIDYHVSKGAGAFYGPKIDFHIEDSLGRTWQCGTIQLDFSMPERFELEYIGKDGNSHRPVMIHRAAFGSVERFMGILVEHYGGAFPVWMAPRQLRVCTISEKHRGYAEQLESKFRQAGIRVDLNTNDDKISYKIRQAEVEKIPYIGVVGDKEMSSGKIAVRARGRKDLGSMSIDDLISKIREEIKTKAYQ